MNCQEARQLMLVADLDELDPAGDGELARHLAACERCADAAERIRRGTALLASTLAAVESTPTDEPVPDVIPLPVRPAKPGRVRSTTPAWISLPIAASIAALLIARPEPVMPRFSPPDYTGVKRPVVQPVVNAPNGNDVAVVKATGDITVVWYLDSKAGT